ncbi:unnamed protein product [Cylicocyclus nassatus]|uniref:Uncharacterized protein n=1 Tax=Cylicocyclus nassatus TaxID=53992 RepID=A0AA36GYA4_CYLNA|nr:unnamed protein product [Cylicocyclus nassatus]
MRPNEDILNEFYGLVELNAQKRYEAVSRLFMKVKSDPSVQEYCVERLVAGLSSTRAAARFGYSTALVLLLSEYHEQWTIEKLFEIADKKLDLHDKDSSSANAIAHHLLACAIFQSGVFVGCDSALLEREFQLYRLCPTLGMTIVQLVAEIALGMEKKTFKSRILPAIKNYLETALTSSSVEFVYLALLLKDRFPSYIADSVSFVQKDGSCSFSQDDLTFLLLTIKKCDSSAVEPFLNILLSSARASGQFALVYNNVVGKWCTSGDESKVLERIFDTAKLTLSSGDATYDEMLAVFSPLLLKRITQIARGKQNAQQRLMHGKAVLQLFLFAIYCNAQSSHYLHLKCISSCPDPK